MKKILTILIVLGVVALGWYAVKHRPAAGAEVENTRPAAKVELAPLVEQPIAQTVEAFGLVIAAPSGNRVIAAPYDCVVRKVLVSAGAAVGAGTLLLEIEPSPDAKLAADSTRSLLSLAAKTLAATQERFELKLATSQELLTAQQAADDARLKADSFAARGLGGDGRISAPAVGVVTNIELSAGALIPAGATLVTVSTGGQLEARLGVEAAEAGAVTPGQAVLLQSSNRGDAVSVATTVRSVGAALDPATGAAEVRVQVPLDSALLFGEHVRAQIELRRNEHALVVPRRAVLPDGDKHILFTVKNGKATRHEVRLGLATPELLEVVGGDLRPGDLVVTLGNYELEDGMAVQAPDPETKTAEAKDTVRSAREAKP